MHKTAEPQGLEQIRAAIQREFIERKRRNPSYSLRAFAHYLDVDQSFLSKVLKGHRRVTPELAKAVGPKLGLKPNQIDKIFSGKGNVLPGFLELSNDEFELLSDWKHFALIELMKTKSFVSEAQSIAKRLKIHVQEVRASIALLERLGFIKTGPKNWKLLTPNTTWTNTSLTTEARRKFQRQALENSMNAIETIPFEYREHGSLTVAVDKNRLPEFKEKMKMIRRELADFLQPDDATDLNEVYQFTMSLFPLSRIDKGIQK